MKFSVKKKQNENQIEMARKLIESVEINSDDSDEKSCQNSNGKSSIQKRRKTPYPFDEL